MIKEADLLKNFVDKSGCVFYLKDEQGRFLMVNHVFEDLYKLSKEEVIGKTDYDLASKEDAEKWRSLDDQVRQTGVPMNIKTTVSTPKGVITVVDHKFPFKGLEEHPNAVGGIAILMEE